MDIETIANKQVLKYAVQRAIFCKRSGVVLDVRRAVLWTVTNAEGKSASECVTGEVWDKLEPVLRDVCEKQNVTLEVIDGRKMGR